MTVKAARRSSGVGCAGAAAAVIMASHKSKYGLYIKALPSSYWLEFGTKKRTAQNASLAFVQSSLARSAAPGALGGGCGEHG
jgi:hypothetical protein